MYRYDRGRVPPLRLQNGLYLQLHAYMLRVAIPYGQLSSAQMRQLADIARRYDKGYGHFTTRQNIQFNWPKLRTPGHAGELADVEMHAIQTSGNCIRNVTTDHFAGAPPDEIDRSAPLVRESAPVVDLPPGIRLPAAQVQDRRHGGPKTAPSSARMTSACEIRAAGDEPVPRLCRRRPGRTPMIGKVVREFLPRSTCSPISTPCVSASTTLWDAARQQVQGAHQDSRGGRADEKAALGEIVGPGLKAEEVPGAIHRVVEYYRTQRTSPAEKFIDTLERLGHAPFQEALYAAG
jgi:hypothetical protein